MVEINETVARIQASVRRLRAEYADDPNVVAIGFGSPERGGKPRDGLAILFHVQEKLPSERVIEAKGSKPIPKEIDGFPTDVRDENYVSGSVGQRDERKYDPLLGGPASSNSEQHVLWFNGGGTLGILGTDNVTGAPVGLSNWHVWADGGSAGDQIIQPGHPTGGDHVEAIGKVLACGPLVTSLIEWESPDPIAAILYGGAAAAAIAAACSDYKDQTRRGQDATVPPAGEKTLRERVSNEILYYDLPLPGYPFRAETIWRYERETDQRVMVHEEREKVANAQFLLGKQVVTDKPGYNPGERAEIFASIWDYQLARTCNDYHVVAHMIPHDKPSTAVRSILQPVPCDEDPFGGTGDGELDCIRFFEMENQEVVYKGRFDWLGYLQPQQQNMSIVSWGELAKGLLLPSRGIQFSHQPVSEVRIKVVQYTSQPVRLRAFAGGVLVGEDATDGTQGVVHTLTVKGNGISSTQVLGGGGEAVLVEYCVDGLDREGEFRIDLPKEQLEAILKDALEARIKVNAAKARQCCFKGSVRIPATSKPGKWDVYLTVQNINNVPEGTKPEVAAATIGGHLLSAQTLSPSGCLGIMLLDHVFDVI
ncbi:hypothetical protein [Roseibium marinum]|uniref:Uncharacterized protein n=1 Tax=Roseibium marinum TaxID=281252 RepID=A0A2S3UYB8_9HYPH|nr:hypothetical protein [Roseibium marinum]POF32718.1 hypothetical protein CLV41_102122 [Roseibium marinum]